MNYNPNTQLTPNFVLKEAIEWARKQPSMSEAEKEFCIALCREHLNSEVFVKIKQAAETLQWIGEAVNAQFPKFKGKLRLTPLSWFRPKAWEIHKKRSGGSQHVPGWGVDFIVTGCTQAEVQEIMTWIFNVLLKDWKGGLAYKLNAQGNYSFIHIDLLITTPPRRWQY